MYSICFYFIMFYFYSIFGWLVECTACSIQHKKLIYNRGFLIGPYCPIYGFGAMYMYLFLNRYSNDPIILFVMAVVGTSLLEYITSYLMEKIFKARWWDYSHMKYNIEGRICLQNALLFGILGIIFIYLINPIFISLLNKLPDTFIIVLGIILFVLFLIDFILSFTIISKLKNNLINIRKDSTEDMDLEVKKILTNYYFYLRKLFKSFPSVKFTFSKGENIIESINNTLDNYDKLIKERKKKIKEIKKELKQKIKN